MTATEHRQMQLKQFIHNTVWIVSSEDDSMFEAINFYGEVIAKSRYKTSLEHQVRVMAANPAYNIWAIARVVVPRKRQPHRKPRKTRE